MLGTSMLLVGNAVLANLNKNATSPHNIGLWAWRLVLGAGIVVIIMGAVNIFTVSSSYTSPF
jgi:glycerol uptake facilitator-like aquaporin